MTRLRRALGPIAAVWIACQIVGLATAPAMVVASSAEMLLECTCNHGDHAVCPMHHKPAPGSKRCLMRSAGDGDTAVLGSLFSGVGMMPVSSTAGAPIPAPTAVVLAEVTTKSLGSEPPDPPTPRA